MFHIDADNKLAYLNSLNVKVFPSGRRKSELVNEKDLKERYHIPIDPEARLNTEANHRKHSGLNGYKQSYVLDWAEESKESILLVLAGYLFNIKLSDAYVSKNNQSTAQLLGKYLAENLKDTNGKTVVDDKIFVNILTADVTFFSSVDGSANNEDTKVSTEILRDQSFNALPEACLDLLKPGEPQNKATSYYFSGLSFSSEPLDDFKAISSGQHVASLPILTKDDNDVWQVYEPSRLPVIEHGETENSVKIPGDLYVTGNINVDGTVTAKDVIIGDMRAITLEVKENNEGKWQLRFHNAKVSPFE